MTSYANDTTATSTASTTTAAAAATNAESAALTTTTTTVDATAVQLNKDMSSNNNNHTRHYDDEDGREKADTTPENIKKIAEIINDKEAAEAAAAAATPSSPSMRLQQQQHHQHQTNASSFIGLGAAIDESSTKFCLGKPPPSPAEKAAVLSRANHHYHHNSNNGSSNNNSTSSSLNNKEISAADEDDSTASNSISTKQALSFTIDHFDASENDAAAQAARYKTMMERFQSRHRRGASMSKLESGTDADASVPVTPTTETATTPAVKLRVRERSATRVRDASKRHSWSPRSSAAAAAAEPAATPVSQRLLAAAASKPKPMPLQSAPAPKGAVNQLANRSTPFQARSTAMQMALQQVELLCPHPPLDDRKPNDDDDDAVSEAGTYTLDGDNYTEEQKDLMNIDRNAAAAAAAAGKLRPKQLSVKPPSRASNVLEVNYYHETPPQQQEQKGGSNTATGVYLQQLKSRVLRQQQAQAAPPTPPSPPHSPAADVGCFTSVTTSGVLAKQRALDTHPKLTRHTHSLSTSQIDSSEYVSNEAKLRNAQAMAMAGSATDRQKAEYRLNVFTSSSNTQQQQQQQHLHQLPETPTTPTEATMLQSAPTKQDWIQEWARNARARSLAQDVSGTSANRRKQQQQQQAQAQAQQLMTRSYNCSDTGADSLTDDSLSLYSQQQRQYAAAAKLNRSLARLLGDCDYASDPALCSHAGGQGGNGEPYKPPKSPSKIPSPLHTLGRARSASRSRPALEQMSSQTTSRRSSVKSPAAQCSPQHSLETTTTTTTSGYRRSPLHRALMTSSINEAQLQLLTSGEYLLKQLHRRKNSLELDVEPHELPSASMCGSISPLRRSSSFQQQQRPLQTMRQARPNFQNLYTPPAARHLQQQQHQQQLQRELKKSASSNNFEHSYSEDYDNELQYYINDEDELGTTGPYYSSGEEEEYEQQQRQQQSVQEPAVPLSNTRLNKALLMRIERSKQRVAGTGQTPSKPSSAPAGKLSVAQAAAAAGLVACPNTPELPRRGIKSAPRAASGCGPKARQSMPRETSLSRLAQQVPSSLANAKKQLLQTANASNSSSSAREPRVQPKYLDISKYKPAQSNSFLRKNDAKSTLKPAEQMKRSPSASSMGLSRGDGTRTSNRSVRSNTSVMNSSTTSLGGGGATGMRASSAARRDASMNKQKEAEMVMWKRRSTYDPMKAAAEDRRRKEEARRAQTQNQIEMQRQLNDVSNDAPFESVQRPANNLTLTGSINYSPRNSMENDAWTLGESSEFGEYPDDYDDDPEEHEDAEYVGGQESSDDVFEPETAEATN